MVSRDPQGTLKNLDPGQGQGFVPAPAVAREDAAYSRGLVGSNANELAILKMPTGKDREGILRLG